MPYPVRSSSRSGLIAILSSIAMAIALLPITSVAADESPTPGSQNQQLVTPVLSARRVPELLRSAIADAALLSAIDQSLDVAPDNSCIIVSNGGRIIVDVRGTEAMVPASTEKLITAVAAFEILGGDTRFETLVVAEAPPSNGVITGDLYLVGGGDPLLTTNGYKLTFDDPTQAINEFEQLADRIADAGIREIRGGIVGDDSRYDTERWVSSWPERYQREGFVGPLSALMVNDGSTGFSENPDAPGANRKAGDPPLLAAETLTTLLEDRGIEVGRSATTGTAPQVVERIATLESLTVNEIVGEMLVNSDNTTAELLVKEFGVRRGAAGTTREGLKVMAQVIADLGLPVEGLDLKDGSGLDPENRVPCTLLDALLELDEDNNRIHNLLPVAGETGTLRKRMVGSPAEGTVRAKTGSLNEVNALAGAVDTQQGDHFDFVYIINGKEPRGIGVLDDFAAALATVPSGPDINTISPIVPRP